MCVDKAGKRSRKPATACCTRVCRQCACRLSAVSTGQHTVPASSRSPLQAHRDSPRTRIKTTDNDPDDAMIWAAAHLGWHVFSKEGACGSPSTLGVHPSRRVSRWKRKGRCVSPSMTTRTLDARQCGNKKGHEKKRKKEKQPALRTPRPCAFSMRKSRSSLVPRMESSLLSPSRHGVARSVACATPARTPRHPAPSTLPPPFRVATPAATTARALLSPTPHRPYVSLSVADAPAPAAGARLPAAWPPQRSAGRGWCRRPPPPPWPPPHPDDAATSASGDMPGWWRVAQWPPRCKRICRVSRRGRYQRPPRWSLVACRPAGACERPRRRPSPARRQRQSRPTKLDHVGQATRRGQCH